MILQNPSAVPHITGMTVGTLTVDSFSHRDGKDFKFNIRCGCGATWTESYRRIMDGFLKQGCHNTACRLGRIPETRITQHEKWLDSPDEPVAAQPEPPKAEPVREVPKPPRAFGRAGHSIE
jgi:hypothetical protein